MNPERIAVRIFRDFHDASCSVASRIAQLIRDRAGADKQVVLGLATGHTPLRVYSELIRLRGEEGLDFSNVVTFNLDEYWPMEPTRFQSYHRWMFDNFFSQVNIKPENIHIPSGTLRKDEIEKACMQYENEIRSVGGIDIQLLGIGRTGHIGFNEPGSSTDSRTRLVMLNKVTKMDAAGDFFGEENVPDMAITMGVGTILEAREIYLLAFGEHKSAAVRQAVEGDMSTEIPASFLQMHNKALFFLDIAAASELQRIATPWILGSCVWDELLERQAVIWLSNRVQKPILKLVNEDYTENGLGELLRERGSSYEINLRVFHRMMSTITGWPGGKSGTKRVLVLSPHPDDDVICMGGTMMRFIEQGHSLHVAYMVSGYVSVFDHDALRHAEFVKDFNRIFGLTPEQTAAIEEHIEKFLRQKEPGDMDTEEVRSIKALIRRTEAMAAAQYCGLAKENVHFLNLPFYESGSIQKYALNNEDIEVVRGLLDRLQPDMIFAAGDLSDPHGTHRLCLEAFLTALESDDTGTGKPDVWLYRGAWEEWPLEQIDMAVPLSPDELRKKRYAIFRHQSQKDRAMFPGPSDAREFWQRAEERNMATAARYDKLGLPEYHAIESFVRWPIPQKAQLHKQLTIP